MLTKCSDCGTLWTNRASCPTCDPPGPPPAYCDGQIWNTGRGKGLWRDCGNLPLPGQSRCKSCIQDEPLRAAIAAKDAEIDALRATVARLEKAMATHSHGYVAPPRMGPPPLKRRPESPLDALIGDGVELAELRAMLAEKPAHVHTPGPACRICGKKEATP